MRNRAGVILWCKSKNQLLLIKRIKNDDLYWAIPGGGLKDGESFECAAKREFYEEVGICVEDICEFVTLNLSTGTEKYYIAVAQDTYDAKMHGEEAKRSGESNQYIPEWISIGKLCEINLLPPELKEYILTAHLTRGAKKKEHYNEHFI